MRFPRQVHHVLEVVLRGAFGVIPFLVEDAVHHMPNALCDQVCTPAAVVEIGVVFEESSGQQPVAHADVPRQLAEMFRRHAVGACVGGSRVI